MKTIYKRALAACLAGAVGIVVFDLLHNAWTGQQLAAQGAEEKRLRARLAELEHEQEEGAAAIEALGGAMAELDKDAADIHKLRAEVTRTRAEQTQNERRPAQGVEGRLETVLNRAAALKALSERFPQYAIPEVTMLTEDDWMELARIKIDPMENEASAREMFKRVRGRGKLRFGGQLARALRHYLDANGGSMPQDILDLRSYFEEPVPDALLSRYEIRRGDGPRGFDRSKATITERWPVDPEHDTWFMLIGTNQATIRFPWNSKQAPLP